MARPRILIITRNLPPLVGGMERLNWHMADELTKNADVKVIGPRGSASVKPASVSLTEAPLKPLPLFLIVALVKGLLAAWRWKPDIILAGSGLTVPLVWLISKISQARSAAYLHGFDITVDQWLYRAAWRPFFKRMDRIIVNSTPTKKLAMDAGVSGRKLGIVHPGTILPARSQTLEDIAAFKSQHGLTGKKIMLSVGRLTTRKGLQEFVAQSLPDIVKAVPDAVLVIVGDAPKNSLGAGIQTRESIQEEADRRGLSGNITFLGVITDKKLLATAYEAADAHVFPVRHIHDDPEGFGMVAIEAAAHGLQTVAFSTGGVVDAVKNGCSGFLVEKNNYRALGETIINSLKNPLPQFSINTFAQSFSWHLFGEKINQILTNPEEIKKTPKKRKRQAHATKDLSSRIPKAKKIERLLNLRDMASNHPIQILEIGCGSGGIAHYFATQSALSCEVTGIDIHDNRVTSEEYNFQKVEGTTLPFLDNSFNVVITNHVIEHVGNRQQQIKHLKEISRVLSPEGSCYLAVPNRWMLTEPHYNLKFLSWLPRNLRTPYLEWRGKGTFYDCEPLTIKEIEPMLREANLDYENISLQAARCTYEIEKPGSSINRILEIMPDIALKPLISLIPTLVYKIKPSDHSHSHSSNPDSGTQQVDTQKESQLRNR